MESVGKFVGGLNFAKSVVQSGSRVAEELNPMLYVDTTYNKCSLNNKAMRMLGAEILGKEVEEFDDSTASGFVALLDNAFMYDEDGNVIGNNEDSNSRFFITRGFKIPGGLSASKLGANNSFSFSRVWSAMQLNEPGVCEATGDSLVSMGLAERRDTERVNKDGKKYISTMFISKNNISYEIVPFNDGEPVQIIPGVVQPIFALINRNVTPHIPKTMNKKSEN